jgi:hypothetical protein
MLGDRQATAKSGEPSSVSGAKESLWQPVESSGNIVLISVSFIAT